MTILFTLSVFVVTLIAIAGMLFYQDVKIKRGLVYTRQVREQRLSSGLFTRIHDLERVFLGKSALFLMRFLRISHKIAVRIHLSVMSHRTVRRFSETVSGKRMNLGNGDGSAPSAYLKDIAEHKDDVRRKIEAEDGKM